MSDFKFDGFDLREEAKKKEPEERRPKVVGEKEEHLFKGLADTFFKKVQEHSHVTLGESEREMFLSMLRATFTAGGIKALLQMLARNVKRKMPMEGEA